MESTTEVKELQVLAEAIAKALGPEWSRAADFDEDGRDWRARLNGPNHERLFLSNTWGPRGMLHVSGCFVDPQMSTYGIKYPSINANLTKSPEQIARDIERRLLPEYRVALAEILKKHVAHVEYKEGVRKTKYRVAEIMGGLAKDDDEIVRGHGSFDIQVCGPDSLRFHGHCLYFTAEQLERIRKAVPELFERAE